MMTVRDLIEELQKWPPSAVVHIDVCSSDTGHVEVGEETSEAIYDAGELQEAFSGHIKNLGGWEGDRVVRGLSGVRWQSGFKAVALDAQTFQESESDEANWIEQNDDTKPLS